MQVVEERSRLIVFAGGLVDNLSGELKRDTAVFICDGLIEKVRTNCQPGELSGVAGYKFIDLADLTLMPAMIDCHVHLALNGRDFKGAVEGWQREEDWAPAVEGSLADALAHGLAFVRDGGDKANIGLKAKQRIQEGRLKGPRVLCCGQAVGKQGRYGSFLGPGIAGLREGLELIHYLKQQGVDWIKILVSGIVSFNQYGKVGEVQFDSQELKELVRCAHGLGLPVMAHASSDEAVSLALDSGVDSVEHGYFISGRSLRVMAEAGVPWVPTVVPVANQVLPESCGNYDPAAIKVITRTYELQLEKIAEAAELGVGMGIGTDAGASGVCHGLDYYSEIELFSRAGLSPQEVIKAATLNAARICGVNSGSIEPGQGACLIGVMGNPLRDLSVLKRPEFLLLA